MRRKFCPSCYLEHNEKIKVSRNGNGGGINANGNGNGNQTFNCRKRGHEIKGPGLTLPELRRLEEFH